MGVNVTRVVKFIRKGDKGSDAVRYWLIPSVSSVSMSDVENGDGKPTPSSVSCRLVKQVGDNTPTSIADASSSGLTMAYALIRKNTKSTPLAYGGGNITVPTNTDYRAIEFYLYQGNQLIDISTIAIVCDGEQGQQGIQGLQGDKGDQGIPGDKGDKGDPGTDGKTSYFHIKYSNVPNPTTSAQMSETPSIYIGTYADFTKTDSDDPNRYTWYRFQGLQGEKGEQGIPGVGENGKTSYLHIKYSNDGGQTFTDNNGEMPGDWIGYCTNFNVQDPTAVSSYTWSKIKGDKGDKGASGDKGDRGPALRGPQAWSDCATGYAFQCGAEGEAWKDVVLYEGEYYSCVKSHAKTADNYPGSTADQSNSYWQLGDKIELVVTKILLASYALVKNLGVECIDMRDAAGNILFQAKDGNVICKTGTFENIKVSGDITAESLNLKVSTNDHYSNQPVLANGSICIQASGLILPELPEEATRSIRIFNASRSRATPNDLVLQPASGNVRISDKLDWLSAKSEVVTLHGCGYNAGIYIELIGVHEQGQESTTWYVSEMNSGIKKLQQTE